MQDGEQDFCDNLYEFKILRYIPDKQQEVFEQSDRSFCFSTISAKLDCRNYWNA
jgi:hypothetical protein